MTVDEIRRRFAAIPANRLLGFELVACTPDETVVAMAVSADMLQEGGVVHGGLIAALADTAAVYALLPQLPAGRTLTSIEYKVNFLRPAVAGGDPLHARSTAVKHGRTIGVCEVTVTQAGRSVALGLFTYLFLDEPDEPR